MATAKKDCADMAGTQKPVRVLILGTGGMANHHAEHYQKIPGVTVVAGIDTNADRLSAFQTKFGMEQGFTSVDDALAWGKFDAVSNVTPDPVHYPTTLPMLAACKHVMCEKPLAVSYKDASDMSAKAKAAGVVNAVNLTYRNGAALQAAAKLVRDGVIGRVCHFEASYLQSWLTQPAWGQWDEQDQWLWRLSTAHGSKGVLGDVGIHILDFMSFAAGVGVAEVSCRLKTFDKAPGGRVGKYTLDANDSCAMHLSLTNGAVGVVHATRFATGHLNDLRVRIYGDKGGIEIGFEKDVSRARLCNGADVQKADWHDISTEPVPTNYERFIAAIRGGAAMDPDFARGAELQAVLDRAEESDGKGGISLKV
jgi:predicted dehydrogenase